MRWNRTVVVLAGAALIAAVLAGCGGASNAKPSGVAESAPSAPVPVGTLVAASHSEHGLIIYGNVPTQYFQPLVNAFDKSYPWIKVQVYDTGDGPAFSRYESEHAQGARTADIIVASSPPLWVQAGKQALLANVTPSDLQNFPKSTDQGSGIFVMDDEPNLIVYNKKLLTPGEYPTSWAALVSDVQSNPAKYRSAGLTISNSLGYATTYGLQHLLGSAKLWGDLSVLAPDTKTFSESLDGLTNLLQGGASVGWMAAGLSQGVLPQFSQIVTYGYMTDATPLIPRGIGITAGASSPDSAQLFLDYIYSQPGQQALCQAGFEATMNNFVSPTGCTASLVALATHVPAGSMYTVPFNQDVVDQQTPIAAHWNSIFKS
jgi:iron(III) transport system substrate-binding protein